MPSWMRHNATGVHLKLSLEHRERPHEPTPRGASNHAAFRVGPLPLVSASPSSKPQTSPPPPPPHPLPRRVAHTRGVADRGLGGCAAGPGPCKTRGPCVVTLGMRQRTFRTERASAIARAKAASVKPPAPQIPPLPWMSPNRKHVYGSLLTVGCRH